MHPSLGALLIADDPAEAFYEGLPNAQQQGLVGMLRHNAAAAFGAVITYAGWMHVRSVYLHTEGDRILPIEMQVRCFDGEERMNGALMRGGNRRGDLSFRRAFVCTLGFRRPART